MSYINVYPSRINWENEPNISTPINATNLNKADYALYAIDQTLAGWDTSKADESDLLLCVKTIDYDTSTGVFVFTWQNGTTKTIDLNIEKIPVSFSMDANGVITMTTEDGTTYTADVGALIKTYTFTDSAVIDFTVTTDASGNKTVTADIVDGSITGQKLQPNYLADCQTAATNSSNSATAAASSKGDSEAWAVGTRGGIPVPSTDPAYNNNSYYWSQHGASNSLAGLTDTDITNPTSGQTIIYDTTDAKWKNGSAVGGGSTIVVTTTETTLYGQNVTITDGTTTLTETFDSTGVATFKGVTMTGNLTIASVTTSTSLNIPYFGNYTAVLSSFSASITVTYPSTASCTCTGNGESYTASGSPYTFTVHGVATYTITTTLDGVTKTDTVIITTDGQTESVTVEYGTINLTYADDFRGQTVNCVNGGTTITKTAPSSGNTMVFYPPTTGTWVISSTVSGSTYTVNAVITSLSTPVSVTLNAIPNGSTVTPTDDIQTWLACAGITDKAYTTLAEVLADTDTYTTLLGDSNACDYMARSTTWADMTSQTGEVPTMTSNTTPSGVVSAGTDYDTNGAYKAFDGDDSTYWRGNTSTAQGATATDYIQYKFASPTIARSALIKNSVSGSAVNLTSVTVSASNDGSTFTPLYSDAITMPSTVKRVSFENDTAYSYYRVSLTVKNVSGSSMRLPHVSTLQFYEDAEIPSDADAMRLLGMYDYACYVLRQDNTWNTAINNSAYASYIPASPTGQTDIIVSAPSDTIYYMDNGSPVTLCTTDTSGIGSVDWSDLPTGDITLYSSVAKNLNDLTADYSKTIKVTKNKVEGYLMPNNTLYWYGYKSAYVQNSTTNTNNISFDTNKAVADTLTGADRRSLLVSNIGINANTVYFIWQGVNMVTSNYGGAWNANSMISTPASNTPNLQITTSNIEVASLSITSGQYIAVGAAIGSSTSNRKSIIYAIYY